MSSHTQSPAPTNPAELLQHQIQMARSDTYVLNLEAESLACQAAFSLLDALVGTTDLTRSTVQRARQQVCKDLTESQKVADETFIPIRHGLDVAENAIRTAQMSRRLVSA